MGAEHAWKHGSVSWMIRGRGPVIGRRYAEPVRETRRHGPLQVAWIAAQPGSVWAAEDSTSYPVTKCFWRVGEHGSGAGCSLHTRESAWQTRELTLTPNA